MSEAAADQAGTARDAVREAKQSRVGRAAAVIGLASRAIVYGAFAVLVLQVTFGQRHTNTDQGSALAVLGTTAAGSVLLVLLVLGVACYALWRWSAAWAGGDDGTEPTTRGRVLAVVEGLAYVPFGYLSVAVLVGDPAKADQGHQYRTLSGRVLQHVWGQVLVGAVGVIVSIVGVFFVQQGARRSFADQFDFPRHRPWVRPVVLWLGALGSVARGLTFVMTGILVVYAAVTVKPGDAGGLDAALDTLRKQPYGSVLLVAAATGFAAFAVFALAEATWRER